MAEVKNKIRLGSGDYVNYSINSNSSSLYIGNKYMFLSDILSLFGKKTIYPRFRIFVLNPDESVCYQIPNEDILAGGSYNENYQNGSRRSLSFSLNNQDGKYTPSINKFWTNAKVSLQLGVEIPEENSSIWFNKGVFVMNTPSPSKGVEKKTVSINCSDKFSILEGKLGTVSETTEFSSGTEIKNIIEDILFQDSGNGVFLDPIAMRYHHSFEGKTLPQSISAAAGSSWASLLLQIADILSAEIFYDSNGCLNIIPVVETMSDGSKPVISNYSLADLQNEDFSFEMESFVNCIYVIGANINGKTVMAKSINDDPSSPLCVSRIGLRVGDIVNDSNITSDSLAQERADYELRKKLIAKSTLNSSVFFNPLLTVNNIVTYTDEEDYELRRERFLIQSLSFNLDYSGLMSLQVSNINNLPFIS